MSTPSVQALTHSPCLQQYWRWRFGLMAALPGFALAVLGLPTRLPLLMAAGMTLSLLGFGLGRRYAGQRFAAYRAELRPGEGVVLHSGVWWRSEAWVPVARLQHLDVSQGPLDRRWGMASLSLHTAGSHDHRLTIEGLPVDEAHALRARLMPQAAIHDE